MTNTPHAQYTLYYSLRSPFARRIRVAMAKLGIEYTPREINVFEPPQDFFEANPLGLIPVLSIQKGKEKLGLPDSATILEYFNDLFPNRIWPSEPELRLQVRACSTLAEGIMSNSVALFLERQRKNQDPAWIEEYTQNLDRTFEAISKKDVFGKPFKVSDLQMTQAGYDLVIALEYAELRIPDHGWKTQYPELNKFLETHRKRQDLAPTAPPPA